MEKKIEGKIQIAKAVGGIIVGIGVTAIVGNIVKSTTPSTVGTLKKLCITATTLVIASIVADKVTEYTDGKIEETAFCIQKIQTLLAVNSEEV